MDNFLRHFPPGPGARPCDPSLAARFKGRLPEVLLALWRAHGLGSYGDGQLLLIDPDAYKPLLYGWLMRDDADEDDSRLPIALTAFGRIIYYRKLGEGEEDVSSLDPHRSSGMVHAWSLRRFLDDYLCEPEAREALLEPALLQAARARLGPLGEHELYYPVPALRLGGRWQAEQMDKGDGRVHLAWLLDLACGG